MGADDSELYRREHDRDRKIRRYHAAITGEMARVLSSVEILLVPSLCDEMLTITNFTGHPSLTLRAGFVEVSRARSDRPPDPAHVFSAKVGASRRHPDR